MPEPTSEASILVYLGGRNTSPWTSFHPVSSNVSSYNGNKSFTNYGWSEFKFYFTKTVVQSPIKTCIEHSITLLELHNSNHDPLHDSAKLNIFQGNAHPQSTNANSGKWAFKIFSLEFVSKHSTLVIICYYIYDNSHLIINSIVSGDVSVQRPHNNHSQDTCREKQSLTQGDRLTRFNKI